MNTVRSVGYGWGVLIVAGAGSYYFAKRQINSDREARAANEERRRQNMERLRAQEFVSREAKLGGQSSSTSVKAKGVSGKTDHPSPSQEAANDPAPVSHSNEQPGSRFEAAQPFRSRKGDRFS